MTANKHTPAPWVMHESATHVRIVGADGENIWHEDKRCHRVMNDARLIAAAPELLEALQDIVTNGYGMHAAKLARSAVEKATGGAA